MSSAIVDKSSRVLAGVSHFLNEDEEDDEKSSKPLKTIDQYEDVHRGAHSSYGLALQYQGFFQGLEDSDNEVEESDDSDEEEESLEADQGASPVRGSDNEGPENVKEDRRGNRSVDGEEAHRLYSAQGQNLAIER